MNQMTFSDMEYSGRKKVTQKEKFLRQMNQIIPWDEWVKKIQPHYPAGKRGRPPRGIEVMLRAMLSNASLASTFWRNRCLMPLPF